MGRRPRTGHALGGSRDAVGPGGVSGGVRRVPPHAATERRLGGAASGGGAGGGPGGRGAARRVQRSATWGGARGAGRGTLASGVGWEGEGRHARLCVCVYTCVLCPAQPWSTGRQLQLVAAPRPTTSLPSPASLQPDTSKPKPLVPCDPRHPPNAAHARHATPPQRRAPPTHATQATTAWPWR